MTDLLSQPQQQQQQSNVEGNNLHVNEILVTTLSSVQNDYDDKYKLANVKEFLIQRRPDGKRLSCGVYVRPRGDRFVIRIYNKDSDVRGQLRTYIQFSWDTFCRIREKKDKIIRYLSHGWRSENIFVNRSDECCISVLPPQKRNNRFNDHVGVLEFFVKKNLRSRQNNRSSIYMSQKTFENMMSCDKILKQEFDECQKRSDKDRKFVDDIANLMAHSRNEGRTNDRVENLAEWYTGGPVTTFNKLKDQVNKKMNKKAAAENDLLPRQ